MIKLVVGLGNPGPEYTKTRHNAGVWFVEELARMHNISLRPEKKYAGLYGKGTIAGRHAFEPSHVDLDIDGFVGELGFDAAADQVITVSRPQLAGGQCQVLGSRSALTQLLARHGKGQLFAQCRLGLCLGWLGQKGSTSNDQRQNTKKTEKPHVDRPEKLLTPLTLLTPTAPCRNIFLVLSRTCR